MALLGCVPRRRVTLQILWLWLGVSRLLTLDMAAEAEAFAGGMLLPRAETGVERRRDHVSRNRFLDRGLNRPAALAEILDQAGELLQLRILRQRRGA